MHAAHMPLFTLAVGLPRCLKTLQATHTDLRLFGKPLNVASRTDVKDWPNTLSVITDSAASFQALFCRPMLDLAFGSQVRPKSCI
jgi:hypothetical protein